MKLSRKPSAVRRRRLFYATILIIAIGATVAALWLRPDPACAYATSIGFEAPAATERTRVQLPADLSQPPFDSYLSASRAGGLDFAGLAGREVVQVSCCIGLVTGTEQQVFLNVYLSGRKVVGAFLTGAESGEAATPVNSPGLLLDPLS